MDYIYSVTDLCLTATDLCNGSNLMQRVWCCGYGWFDRSFVDLCLTADLERGFCVAARKHFVQQLSSNSDLCNESLWTMNSNTAFCCFGCWVGHEGCQQESFLDNN